MHYLVSFSAWILDAGLSQPDGSHARSANRVWNSAQGHRPHTRYTSALCTLEAGLVSTLRCGKSSLFRGLTSSDA